MPRVVRMFVAATALVFAGTMSEAPIADAFAQTAKQTRAKKAKAVTRGATVRQSSPAASPAPAASSYDRSTAGGGGGY